MLITNAADNQLADTLKHYQSLYDSHRFLDLYGQTYKYWDSSTDIDTLSIDALVLGARLASRLGGQRLSRWLLRRALQRAPGNPQVRYYARYLNLPRVSFLDKLKAFIANPDIGGSDDALRAFWHASFAHTWAMLRDFDRAYDCLRIAHESAPGDSWVLSLESGVYGIADRWSDALLSAERALEVDPGAPFAVRHLGMALLNLGRAEEAAARLFVEAESSQSYELVINACWHQCAFAEILNGEQRRFALNRAGELASRLPSLMPLADRETRRSIAHTNLDIADLADDYEGIERWSGEVGSPFHQIALANFARNIEGKRIRLPFRRAIQKHQACVPTSIEAAMSANGMIISADEMAADITFGGTYGWAAADWLRSRGYHVRFFSAIPDIAVKLIRNNIAFVIALDGEDSGHSVAVVGLDERAETLLVHDPDAFRSSEYLFTALDPLAGPLGIRGMAAVRPEHASLLDSLLPSESEVVEAAQEYYKQSLLHGSSASRQVVDDLLHQFPSHPGSKFLESMQLLEDGQVGQALSRLKELLRDHPNSPAVRVQFFAACRALGNSALLRQALKDIVEAGKLPGLEARQDWVYPPDRYIYEYADLLRCSTETLQRAESLLLGIIQRQWTSAGAWHNLADLLWEKQDRQSSLLCYRISACLAENDEHFARAYADALAGEKQEEEGFQWLESRVRRFQNTSHSASTWLSWIGTLETRGYPQRAISACNEVLAQENVSAEILSFAVPFLARMGEWTRAQIELERLQKAGLPCAFYEASTRFHQMRGDLQNAAQSAKAWVLELPRSIDARNVLLDIVSAQDGNEAAVLLSRQWMCKNRNHEDFETAYCTQLDRAAAPKWKKFSVLLRRLKRNPEDAWAWREVAFDCLYEYDLSDTRRRKRLEPRILRFLAECNRTSAGAVQTVRAHALWAEFRGDWNASVALSLDSIALAPESFYSYQRAWECSSRMRAEEREALWSRMESMFSNSSGSLSIARDVVSLIADRFGLAAAEKSVESLRTAHPEDPDALNAAANLLIDYGQGRSDAARATGMLEPAVLRYPFHSGLRMALANAYRRAGRDAEAEGVLTEIALRHPDNSSAKIQLAWIRHRKGGEQSPNEILDEAMSAEPQNSSLLDARVQILIDKADYGQAIQCIEKGLLQRPRDVTWRKSALTLFVQCGAAEKAVRAARIGVEIYPFGAYLWLLLGRTLNEMRQYAQIGEIEGYLRKSLQLNHTLFEAAELLSMLLAEQGQYDQASKIMLDIEPFMPNPFPARGRLAWICRQQGKKNEAIASMTSILADAPWYGWGWDVLMNWLEEDAAWDQSRRLFLEIPPSMYANPSFRHGRLLLLEKAEVDATQLNEEWDRLLRDFPEDLALHLKRYDILEEALRWKDAAAVIDDIECIEPHNPFVLARRCAILSHEGAKNAALEIALRICFLSGEEYIWPSNKVWDIALSAGFAKDLSLQFKQRLVAGNKPALNAFSRMASYTLRDATKRINQSHIAIWFPRGGARELVGYIKKLSKTPWDSSEYRGLIYSLFCDYGYDRLVAKLSAQAGSAEVTSVNEWSQIGRAFIGARLYADGRKFFRKWRERTGVAMWMATNYVLSLSCFQHDQLQERYDSTRDALAGLPHDHCAKYLTHVQAEACALLGDKEKFLECWTSYSRYLDGKVKEEEYFRPRDRHLLANIPKLSEYFKSNQAWRARCMIWKLWLKRISLKQM